MILVFHCYGGAHTSITAANIYLGRLPRHRRPGLGDILRQPGFDWMPHTEIGRPLFMGTDVAGRPVYCIGLGAGKERVRKALQWFLADRGVPPAAVGWVDALPAANNWMRIGGFLSRRLGLVAVGRPLVTVGVWRAYGRFRRLVADLEQSLAAGALLDGCAGRGP